MEKSNNTGKLVGGLLLGAVVGGAIGAALGMLFASEKGSDLRKRLSASGDDLTDNLKSKFQNLVADVRKEAGTGKIAVEQFIDKSTSKSPLNN